MTARPLVLKPMLIVDGDGSALPEGSCLRLENGRITAIGQYACVNGGEAATLPLDGQTLLPGFIDLHGYLSVEPDRSEPMRRMFDPDLASRRETAIAHMRSNLASGVTTMRVMGEGHGLDAEMAAAVSSGAMDGPEIVRCGAPVAPSRSHQAPPEGGLDSAGAISAAIRDRAREGVDFIKLVLTGGINSAAGSATSALYGEAEIDMVFGQAQAAGLPVAVAAHGGPAVAMAARRGAVSIEHCALFDDDALAAISETGTTPVLTLTRFFAPDGIARSASASPALLERLELARERLAWLCARIAGGGMPFGLGTDNMPGRICEDAALAVRFGLALPRAIAAITGHAALVLGRQARIGWLRAGHDADIVAVEGNPLTEIEALGAVRRLWRKGREITPRAGSAGRTHQ